MSGSISSLCPIVTNSQERLRFQFVDQLVELQGIQPRLESAGRGGDLETGPGLQWFRTGREAIAQSCVDDVLERPAAVVGDFFQRLQDVIVNGECGSHVGIIVCLTTGIKMLPEPVRIQG